MTGLPPCELERLRNELRDAGDDEEEIVSEAYQTAFEHALKMPIRRAEDIGLKAEFALRFCDVGGELQKVLAEIVTFDRPDLAGALPIVPVFAA